MHYSFDQGVGEYHCAAAPKPLVAETQEIGVVLQLEAYLKKNIVYIMETVLMNYLVQLNMHVQVV